MTNMKFSGTLLIGILLIVNACTFDKEDPLQDCSLLESVSAINITNSSCGEASGSIEVTSVVSDEFEGTVSYSINGSAATTNPKFDNLSAGNYEISAQISDDCSKSISVTIDNEEGLNVGVTLTDSDCGSATGKIEITPSGEVGTVSYSLNGGASQTNAIFQNLEPGTYSLVAIDDVGCEVNQEIKLLSVINASDIQSIINNNCAVSSCHGGSVAPDLSTLENIEASANRIKERTSAQTMPPSGSSFSLTSTQIEDIACWFDDLD